MTTPRMLFLDDQPCPVCGQKSSHLLHQTTYPEHGYHGTFAMRVCDGCGLLFNAPRLDDEGLGQLYGRNYYFFLRKDQREFNRIVAMYQRTIKLIESKIDPKRSIDIGCGRGYFPAVLKKLGWDAYGVEISKDAADYARQTFALDVFTGTIEKYAQSTQMRQFPLVTAIDVIEHVPDPHAFVESAVKVVAPGGYLIIDTPNAAAQNIKSKGTSWKGFNPFHIYLFSIEHLTTLLTRYGMDVELSLSYGNTPASLNPRDMAIDLLKRTHLIKPVVSGYFTMKKLTIRNGDPTLHVTKAAERTKYEPAYTETHDHAAPLAASKTGDNIVVVARKPK